MAAVVVEDLHKMYGGVSAVSGVSFSVSEGEVFALLGPNGAGKTSTVEILEGYRVPTSGHVSVLGYDPQTGGSQFRDRIGIVLQEAGIEPQLRVCEAVTTYASVYSAPLNPDDLIDLVGLSEKRNAPIRTLSGGQQRRLDLALALVGDPQVLFLDEPTTGFDPAARRRAWHLIEELRGLGKTILLTTHYLDEAQHLADRVAVINHGSIVTEGSPASLMADRRHRTTIRFRVPEGLGRVDLPIPSEAQTTTDGAIEFATREPTEALYHLTEWSRRFRVQLAELEVRRPTLEEIYLELVDDEEARP
jgi:ABC-2 type transport system ATP-binding protein